MMSILAGTELLGGIVSPAGQGNRIETYWKRYMASVNNRFNYVAEIASDLTRNGIGHSYLTHFGVLVVRGAPSLHSTRPSNDWFTFDCLELDRDFRRSYELAIADILADREEAQKRVSRLVEHDLEKARRQLQALPIGLFPITPPTQAQLATLLIPGI